MLKLNVMLNFYFEKDSDRRRELEFSFLSHLTNPEIDSVSVIIKKVDEDYLKSLDDKNKTIRYFFDDRATYNHFFSISADYSESVNLFCNADIFFDKNTAVQLKKFGWKNNTVMALSRWDLIEFPAQGLEYNSALFNREDSQDTWVFKGALPFFSKANFPIGVPGCDNAIAFVLQECGYRIINPALDFRTYHLHLTNFRTYEIGNPHTKISPPYLYVTPCSTKGIPHENYLQFIFYRLLKTAFSFVIGKIKRTYQVKWHVG